MKNYHFSSSGTDDSYWRELTVVKKKNTIKSNYLRTVNIFQGLKV